MTQVLAFLQCRGLHPLAQGGHMVTPCPYCKMTLRRDDALDIRTDDHGTRYVVCPHCQKRIYYKELPIEQGSHLFFVAKGFHAGMSKTKGWFRKIVSKMGIQRNRDNAITNVEHTYDSVSHGDRHTERVTLCETGEVIFYKEERLSDKKHR
jgi:DNA-directed RNA polymerase subunit RPC12/RpoP